MALQTEEILLNMGPHHPSTHGVLRFILQTDGEVIHHVKPDVGFLHRSIEKIAEKVTYNGFMPFTDRIDYLGAMNCNVGYALAVEKLLGIEIPERAKYLRVIAAELCRIASHLIMIGSTAIDLGAATPFLHAIRERETINDLFEMLCGARLTFNYARIGGVAFDLPEGFKEKTLEFLDRFQYMLDEINRLFTYNKILIERLANVGVITKEDAIEYGLSGPNLRASGVNWDLRKNEPYLIYDRVQFDVALGDGSCGTLGDCYDRYMVRVKEMFESSKIVRQCLEQMPQGEIMAKIPKVIKPPQGEVYVATEAPRGELGFYIISDGSKNPYRVKIRTGSFSIMSIVEKVCKGIMIADMVAFIASTDVLAPEVDR